MADEKISEMPAASLPLDGTELIPLVKGVDNVQAPSSCFVIMTITNSNPVAAPANTSNPRLAFNQNNGRLWIWNPGLSSWSSYVTFTNVA